MVIELVGATDNGKNIIGRHKGGSAECTVEGNRAEGRRSRGAQEQRGRLRSALCSLAPLLLRTAASAPVYLDAIFFKCSRVKIESFKF